MGKLIKLNTKYIVHSKEIETIDRHIALREIFIAILRGSEYFIRYITSKPEANLKVRDSFGRNILHFSTIWEKALTQEIILKHNFVDINARTITGATAVDLAVGYKMPLLLMNLIKYNAIVRNEQREDVDDLLGLDNNKGYLDGAIGFPKF